MGAEPVLVPNVLPVDPEPPPHTRISRDRLFSHPRFDRYDVLYEHRVYMTTRHGNEVLESTIVVDRAVAYQERGGRLLYVRANSSVAGGIVRCLKKHAGMVIDQRQIDVDRFRSENRLNVKQAYFTLSRDAQVKSANIAGDRLSDTADYIRYLGRGSPSCLRVEIAVNGLVHNNISVSRDNTIFFHGGSEAEALDLALQIDAMLEPYAEARRGRSAQREVLLPEGPEAHEVRGDEL